MDERALMAGQPEATSAGLRLPPMRHFSAVARQIAALRRGAELRDLETGAADTFRYDRDVMGAERLLPPVPFIEKIPVFRTKPLEVVG